MLAAFLPPYPFRAQSAPYLWGYYRLLTQWADESAFFILGRDYVSPVADLAGRWECDPAVQSRLGYRLPEDTMPARHHYAWLAEDRFDHWLEQAGGNPIEAFRRFLCERDAAFEAELAALLDSAPTQLEAVVTICNVPSLEAVCASRGIPVIHIELGALRGPLYRETGYVDFSGVNGHTESAVRYAACIDWTPPLTTRELLRFFLIQPEYQQQLPEQITHECGVVLQVEDDSNLVAYNNGMNNLALIAAARQKVADHELLVRPHPGSPFFLRSDRNGLDQSPNSLAFVARCREILSINSSVGLEALLLDKPLRVWGDNSYNFVLAAQDEAERLRRLSFYLFGYLVPFSLQLNPAYLRFRLSQPDQQDIIHHHLSEYMRQDHLDPKLFEELPASLRTTVAVQFANLSREHQVESRAWQECETDLVERIDQLAATQSQQAADYEREILRQRDEQLAVQASQAADHEQYRLCQQRESLRIIEMEQRRADDALQQAEVASHQVAALESMLQQQQQYAHQQQAQFEAWQQQVTTSLSWRMTMPVRLLGRLLRGDIDTLRQSWRQLCDEGGRRGALARQINPLVRAMLMLARDPSLLLKAYRSARQQGVPATLQRIRHLLSNHSHYAVPEIISLGDCEAGELVIMTTPHCHYLAELMRASLAKVNIKVEIRYQMPDEGYRDVLHIVICPQMFPTLPGQYIAYQMEQSVSSRWFTEEYLSRLEHSLAIFDYSLRNIEYLQDKGLSHRQLYYLPVGYLPLESTISSNETVDVLFYGDINNDRRRAYIAELKKHFSVSIINDLFGDALYAEMAKAKVVVNIHYYEGALLETTRLYECLSQNKIIVSEASVDMDEQSALLPLVDFVPISDIAAMVVRVKHWVSNEDARSARRRELKSSCEQAPDWFSYYFLRLFLAHDLITYEKFYDTVGSVIQFDTDIICLGLPETVSRRADFDKDNHYGIQYFPGLRHRLGWVGCGLSYKFLLNRAKDLNLPQVTICEDDVLMPSNFINRYNKINGYLTTRDDWDLFAGLIAVLHDDVRITDIDDSEGERYVSIDKMISMVCNIYSSRFYEKLLCWDSSLHDAHTNTIDRFIESHDSVMAITTPTFLVGHKEDLNSTLWGFSNSTYSELIKKSERKLQDKITVYDARAL